MSLYHEVVEFHFVANTREYIQKHIPCLRKKKNSDFVKKKKKKTDRAEKRSLPPDRSPYSECLLIGIRWKGFVGVGTASFCILETQEILGVDLICLFWWCAVVASDLGKSVSPFPCWPSSPRWVVCMHEKAIIVVNLDLSRFDDGGLADRAILE